MEWAAVILWALVVGLALPLGAGAVMGAPTLGLQPICALGGFALCVLFIVLGGGTALAWCAFGLAVLGALLVVVGARQLISDDRVGGGDGEETVALLAGVAGPMFGVVAAIALLVA